MSRGAPRHRRPDGEVRRLIRTSIRDRRRDLAALSVFSLVEAVPALLAGRLVAQAVDSGFLAGETATGFAWLGVMAGTVLIGSWGTRQTYLRLAVIVEPFRDGLVTLVVGAALRRSTMLGHPADIAGVARLTSQVERVRDAQAALLIAVQSYLVTTVAAIVGLLTLAPPVALLVLPPVVAALAYFAFQLKAMAAAERAQLVAEENVAEAVSTVAGGVRGIAASGGEAQVLLAAGSHVDALARAQRAIARLSAVRTVALGIGGWLPVVLVLAAAPWLMTHGTTTGVVLGALTYLLGGIQPALQTLVRGLAGPALWLAVTLRRIARAAPTPATVPPSTRVGPVAVGHDLELGGVTFWYGRHATPVVRDLDLVIPDGDHLAVVGPSGVGKSTLAGLMTGMLAPQAGEVLLGGRSLTTLGGADRYAWRVLIPQEAYIFQGTLWENLTYLRPDATSGEVDAVVDALGCGLLVERLGGYAAPLDPAALSAGERQLIALARAHLCPARLVVLDEATCHLDPMAELRAERAFARRSGTLIVVAHRISSAVRAKRVLVMGSSTDGGDIAIGTHDELLTGSALYRDLVGHWQGSPPRDHATA